MMGRKGAVDRLVQQNVPAGQTWGALLADVAGRAVSGVPGDGQRPVAVIVARQPRNIILLDRALFDPSSLATRSSEAPCRLAELLDRRPVERLALKDELETVMVGRVVRAGDHDPALDAEHRGRVIAHRR